MWGTKKGTLGKRGKGKTHTPPELCILWSVRHGRAAIYLPLIPGWAFKPLTHSSGGGQGAALPGDPRATLLKPPGLWERGMREERFPTPVRVSTALMSRDSLWFKSFIIEMQGKEKGRGEAREKGKERGERRGEDKEKGKRREK